MSGRASSHRHVLRKRLNWLTARIAIAADQEGRDLSLDRAEADALEWALEKLEQIRESEATNRNKGSSR